MNADVAKAQRFAEDRMDSHKNARLTPKGREQMVGAVVDCGMSKAAAARQFNTTLKMVAKWAKPSVPTSPARGERWWARRKRAFAHPTITQRSTISYNTRLLSFTLSA